MDKSPYFFLFCLHNWRGNIRHRCWNSKSAGKERSKDNHPSKELKEGCFGKGKYTKGESRGWYNHIGDRSQFICISQEILHWVSVSRIAPSYPNVKYIFSFTFAFHDVFISSFVVKREIKLIVKVKLFCRNNAGKFSQNLEFSEDKIEMTFATNYLGNIPSQNSCIRHKPETF
mgnify:FL=1